MRGIGKLLLTPSRGATARNRTGTPFSFREQQNPSLEVFRASRRFKVSAVHEPPLDGTVLEKPCTLILLEDLWLYKNSWGPFLESTVPARHGMAYATLTLERMGLNERVNEMKQDLSTFHDAVLITRGPLASWTALFFLESLPLTGLVGVDPVQFDDPNYDRDGFLQTFARDKLTSRLILEASEKRLKLEPNAVPMLILHSIGDDASRMQCDIVASRHGDPEGPFGVVKVRECPSDDPEFAMQEIDEWIESIL